MIGRLAPGANVEPLMPGLFSSVSVRVSPCVASRLPRFRDCRRQKVVSGLIRVPGGGSKSDEPGVAAVDGPDGACDGVLAADAPASCPSFSAPDFSLAALGAAFFGLVGVFTSTCGSSLPACGGAPDWSGTRLAACRWPFLCGSNADRSEVGQESHDDMRAHEGTPPPGQVFPENRRCGHGRAGAQKPWERCRTSRLARCLRKEEVRGPEN